MHKPKHPHLIREAVERLSSKLPGGPRITAARISIHRSTPLFAGRLPAILIYTRDERIGSAHVPIRGLRYRLGAVGRDHHQW